MPTKTERASAAMRVTTVRFGDDLWALLEGESRRVGVSVSQYVREAALARAAAAAAARGSAPFELLAGSVRDVLRVNPDPAKQLEAEQALSVLARITAEEMRSDAHAVAAEAAQVRRRGHDLRGRRQPDHD